MNTVSRSMWATEEEEEEWNGGGVDSPIFYSAKCMPLLSQFLGRAGSSKESPPPVKWHSSLPALQNPPL